MSLSDELRDPWGLVVAGVAGGMASAFAAPAVAIAVAAGVFGAKVISGALVNREPRRTTPQVPRPPRGTAADGWLRRAEAAVRSLDDMAATTTAGPTGTAVRSAADEAGDTLADLSRVAAQVTAVESALGRVDVHGLDEEAARLEQAARRARTPEVEAEIRRSAAAVNDRLEVRSRLLGVRETLLARMEAVTFGLEGLGARLAEVLAMTATTGGVDTCAQQISDLALELEGLRAGLVETEALSRRALDAAPD
ncbi:MAG: hypothetical protein JWN77_2700 [Frankiales bacterium]|nr:hypothetical protein [Frankiales bacterium]